MKIEIEIENETNETNETNERGQIRYERRKIVTSKLHLHCTALYCTVQHCTALTVLYSAVQCCTVMYYAALCCTVLYCTCKLLFFSTTLMITGVPGIFMTHLIPFQVQ